MLFHMPRRPHTACWPRTAVLALCVAAPLVCLTAPAWAMPLQNRPTMGQVLKQPPQRVRVTGPHLSTYVQNTEVECLGWHQPHSGTGLQAFAAPRVARHGGQRLRGGGALGGADPGQPGHVQRDLGALFGHPRTFDA